MDIVWPPERQAEDGTVSQLRTAAMSEGDSEEWLEEVYNMASDLEEEPIPG